MALTHALATNRYGEADLIVSSDASQGTHTTLAGAMADAVSGQTIFLRTSVTENVTLTAGVNIAAWTGGTLNTPTVTGTLTMTAAGTCNISGIRLATNSAALLAVTGSAASIVNLNNCYLNCSNNTGITFSTSSSSAQINIVNCQGNLGTTGISLFSHSSAGTLSINYSQIMNSGGATTASTVSAGVLNSTASGYLFPVTVSSTGAMNCSSCDFSVTNTTNTTLGGSGAQLFRSCNFTSGTASAVSISTTATLIECNIDSSNTNTITGVGTLRGNANSFTSTSSGVNVTTKTMLPFGITALWTPNLQINGSNTGITYTGQTGGYTIIGNVVSIWGDILLSNKGASVGNITISNLPVAASTNGGSQMLGIFYFNQYTDVGYTTLGLQLTASSAVMTLIASGSAVGVHAPQNTTITNTFNIRFSGIYIID